MTITIVDYGLGNINSIYNSLIKNYPKTIVSKNHKDINKSDKIVIPGVGSFNYAMKKLNDLNLIDSILEFNNKKKTILGICLGMQILFEDSEETYFTKGLGLLQGNVKSIKNQLKLKSPNVGWRKLSITDKSNNISVLKNINSDSFFYFIHSYYAENTNIKDQIVYSKYVNKLIPSIVIKDNIIGVQFHPEKSGNTGNKFLQNFVKR